MIIDASAAVKWFVNERESEASRTILLGPAALTAPDILPVEVAGALVRKYREGNVTARDVRESLAEFTALAISYSPAAGLLEDAVTLALAHRHPLPDCLYLALARRSGTPLATFDRRLASLAARMSIAVWTPA
jgi:predicted nucleic acid-binding protein